MSTLTVENKSQNNNSGAVHFNPFPGLRPFSTDESHLFFGREGQSQEVLRFLAANRFVALIGTSGSGKSSLMYCGVIPILQGGFITKAGAEWKIITTRPGQNPVKNLAESLSGHFNGEENELQNEYIYTTLAASSVGLVEILKQIPKTKKQNILLLVDQFEELFRFRKIKNTTEAFNEVLAYIKLLLEVLNQSEVPAYIVMTMRSDFIGECAQFQELTRLINDSHYLIPQMTRKDFRAAIEGPIAVGGGKITPFLVQQLLNDLGDNPDQLPILQHALMRTWEYWVQSNNTSEPIDIKDYENIGKLEKALSEHANEAYNELDHRQREICQNIFKTLTEKGGDNRGVRRPTMVSEIAEIANARPDEVIDVVEHFRIAGRSFLAPQPPVVLNAESVIDISHESLMRIWDKMILWVSEEYEAVQMYKRLADSAEKYQQGETGLWRPPDLLLALNWKEKQKPTLTWAKRHNPAFERTMVYLNTSRQEYELEEENKIKQQKKAVRRARVFALVLGTASIISLFFMIDSFMAKRSAEEQKLKAEEQTIIANQERAKALEQSKIAEEQKSLAQLKEQEALEQKELADREKRNAQLSAIEAKRQEGIANQKSEEASAQKQIAELSAEEAKKQQQLAEEASLQAQKLRMLSISQSMAVKSLQIDLDTNLRALVAYQAFLFNNEFGGNTFNPDVYNGLYFAQNYFYGNQLTDYLKHNYQVKSIVFTPGGEKLYSTGSDGIIINWDLQARTNSGDEFFNTNNTNRMLALSPDGNYLYLGVASGELLRFNRSATPATPELLHQFGSAVNALTVNTNGTLLACDNSGKFISIDPLTKTKTEISNALEIKELITTATNKYLGIDKFGQLISIESLTPLEYTTYELNYSADGKTAQLNKVTEPSGNATQINSFAVNKNNQLLAMGDLTGNIILYNLKTMKFQQRLTGHSARINSLDFSPDGSMLASASNDGSALVWTTSDFNLAPYQLKDNTAWIIQVKFSPDNKALFAAYADGKIRRWPTQSDELAQNVIKKISRNFSVEEWQQYVAADIEYQKTLSELP
jgi:WD40 repeat protein